MSEQNTTDVTDAVPTLENETRDKIKKGAFIAIGVVGALLLIDDQVKKLKERKSIKLTVEDKPES